MLRHIRSRRPPRSTAVATFRMPFAIARTSRRNAFVATGPCHFAPGHRFIVCACPGSIRLASRVARPESSCSPRGSGRRPGRLVGVVCARDLVPRVLVPHPATCAGSASPVSAPHRRPAAASVPSAAVRGGSGRRDVGAVRRRRRAGGRRLSRSVAIPCTGRSWAGGRRWRPRATSSRSGCAVSAGRRGALRSRLRAGRGPGDDDGGRERRRAVRRRRQRWRAAAVEERCDPTCGPVVGRGTPMAAESYVGAVRRCRPRWRAAAVEERCDPACGPVVGRGTTMAAESDVGAVRRRRQRWRAAAVEER